MVKSCTDNILNVGWQRWRSFHTTRTDKTITLPYNSVQAQKEYSVFRKQFHVPREWKNNEHFKPLLERSYVTSDTKQTFLFIEEKLKALGYMESNNTMSHDYLHFMLVDMLAHNKELFLTEKEIKQIDIIKQLLGGNTPDFVIKKKQPRKKTLIIDIYVGDKDPSEIKAQYRKLGDEILD